MTDLTSGQRQQGRFWKKYLRLTRAGVTSLRALEIIFEEEPDEAFRGVIQYLHDQLREGYPLSESMTEHGDHFSLSVRELIRTAEKDGHWDLVLEELAAGLLEGTFE